MLITLLKSHSFIHIFVQKIFYLLRSKQSGAHGLVRIGSTKKRPPQQTKQNPTKSLKNIRFLMKFLQRILQDWQQLNSTDFLVRIFEEFSVLLLFCSLDRKVNVMQFPVRKADEHRIFQECEQNFEQKKQLKSAT